MRLCLCVYEYMCVCVHICLCVRVCTYACVYVSMCMRSYVRMRACADLQATGGLDPASLQRAVRATHKMRLMACGSAALPDTVLDAWKV